MIKIKGECTSLDWKIINSIKDVSVKNIEFKNITFECETITDASGNLFEKREKGKWIPIDEDSDVYECDVCRTTYDTICGTFDLPDFCPHCGADMRGDQNG